MESQTTTAPPVGRGKDKMVAGLLGIFLGGLGVHQFYLGSNTTGIIEIVLSVVSCYILGSICGIVEGIMILVMSQEEFDARYNRRAPESVEFVFMKPKT
jgi:TM2 domain-containing membrane protein YozV